MGIGINLENIGGVFSGIGDLALKIRTAITGVNPEKKAEVEMLLAQMESAAQNAQAEINKVEAASEKLFKSGWRPFIGWTCGVALAFNYVFRELVQWILDIFFKSHQIVLPTIDLTNMMPLVVGMLGIAGYRTYEKVKK